MHFIIGAFFPGTIRERMRWVIHNMIPCISIGELSERCDHFITEEKLEKIDLCLSVEMLWEMKSRCSVWDEVKLCVVSVIIDVVPL